MRMQSLPLLPAPVSYTHLQTEAKLRRENVQGKSAANQTHYNVGKEIRDTISRLGGTMPEDLPTPNKSIKQIEREQKKLERK